MMRIKMLLTDLDGTLLGSDGSVSAYTKQVLETCRRRGILIAIATARYWIGAERYIREIRPDYEITTDGTLICQNGRPIYSRGLEIAAANQIIQDLLAQNPQPEITVAAGCEVLWNSRHIAKSERLHKAVYCDYRKPLSCQVNKIAAVLPAREIAAEIARKNHCRLQSYRGEQMYAFLPEGAGKVQAIRALAKQLGISLEEIAAFGDDKNDVEMLQICGTGVAVANAVPEAKAAADCVTLSNDEDGVARWLEEEVLGGMYFRP